MTPFTRLAVLALVACAHAQYQDERAPRYIASEPKAPASTPVPILKQINRHNEDGSYTYGYEAADGSFKIETKSPAGEVKGKYGYKDDTGKVRVIEYGANKYGFQPAGEGITVAPPTLVDETRRDEGQRPGKQSQSRRNQNQYQPAPAQSIDYDYNDEPAPPPPPRPVPRPAPRPAPQPQYRPQPAPQPQYRPQPAPQYRAPVQQSHQQFGVPSPTQAPQYRPAPQSQGPTPPKPAFFAGASPVPAEDNFFNPEPQQPQRRQYQSPKQDFRPAPQFRDYNQDNAAPAFPRQQEYSSPSYSAPRPPPPQKQGQTFSMLDELLKEYALPKNGAPALHDIVFGAY
uniref:Cuticular protein n=1 Tax=Heliothis virescens TaxID=7102 RepID=A0A2A4J7H2_HELVI